MFSFYLNTFKINLVTPLASLKFHSARHVISQEIYRTIRRPSEYQQCYTHHRLKTATLGDERFAVQCESSKIISSLM